MTRSRGTIIDTVAVGAPRRLARNHITRLADLRLDRQEREALKGQGFIAVERRHGGQFVVKLTAVMESFPWRVDFAQLIKVFGRSGMADERYTPGVIKSTSKRVRQGNPDPKNISTSIIERSNLTVRMRTRRMTRLTNAFSKLWANHEAALALFFVAHNFVIPHGTLRTTPTVAQGLATHPWTVEELLYELAKHG